jgi:teichuronic acid biosynthesis glycosyltransferase TuaG
MLESDIKPLVSVIVPIYNAVKYLDICCQSILAQTYANWEALLVDDKSSDHSKEIAKRYVGLDPRFYLMDSGRMPKDPVGPWLPRNQGLLACRGDYVCFLDADDLWRNDKLSKQLALLKMMEANLCVSAYIRFTDKGGLVSEVRCPPSRLTSFLLEIANPIPLSSVLVRKDLMSENFRPVPHEDHDIWQRIYSLGHLKYSCLKEPVTAYRIHDSNLTGSWKNKLAMYSSKNNHKALPRRWIRAGLFLALQARYLILSLPSRIRKRNLSSFGFIVLGAPAKTAL